MPGGVGGASERQFIYLSDHLPDYVILTFFRAKEGAIRDIRYSSFTLSTLISTSPFSIPFIISEAAFSALIAISGMSPLWNGVLTVVIRTSHL